MVLTNQNQSIIQTAKNFQEVIQIQAEPPLTLLQTNVTFLKLHEIKQNS